jgi:hypothetical protein
MSATVNATSESDGERMLGLVMQEKREHEQKNQVALEKISQVSGC